MGIRIKDIPINERPRERLIYNGVQNLSNEELLAIILKTGSKKMSAKDLAIILLNKVGDFKKLTDLNYETLNKIDGIGAAKACMILSVLEISKRLNKSIDTINNIKFNNCSVVYEYYKYKLSDKKQEYFYCIYLDNSKRIIEDKLLYIGTINYSVVHPREVFKQAYLLSASSIICVHNHPSNNILPSKQDIELTLSLVKIGELLGIKVLDHIIIGRNNYYSFLENGDI